MAITIAIDGPASSGKGTVARMVARQLGYAYVDTGAMYRTVALLADRARLAMDDEPSLSRLAAGVDFRFGWDGDTLQVAVGEVDVTDEIRTDRVGQLASDVAVIPGVRAALLGRQRALGADGGVVMDGRDIGTVVLPNAQLKVYLDATAHERAHRRYLEFQRRGIDKTEQSVLDEIVARDRQDSERATAPLRAADDAVRIDSTPMTATEVAERVLVLVSQRLDATDLHG